jgi:general secretion pathway protein J
MIKGQAANAKTGKGQAAKLARLNCLPLAGFTLVEVLVTMVILALLGLGAASVVQTMTSSKEQSEQSIARLAQLQYFMLTLEQDLRSMVARPNTTGQLLYFSGGQLAFVRGGWFNPAGMLPRSTLQPVAYVVREQQLVREYFPYVDISPGEEAIEQIVLDGVTDMQARFYFVPPTASAGAGTAAVASLNKGNWSSSWERANELPQAIEITITTEHWGELRRVFLLTGGDFAEQAPPQREGTEPPPTPDSNGGGGNG